ncbi:MAG: alpha,alpha-trehalose-phosphate synthase [Dehalococcoidia bacterium]|nr:alpha,alpha-trehalose-phosphate synthase [Dehalococcoidia bacterium]
MGSEGRVVVVSNRAPSIFARPSAEERRALPVGGLVSSLRPFLEASGGIWMGWDGKPDGQEGAAPAKITEVEGIKLASVSLSRDEVGGFYDDFSNQTLWPLLHGFPRKTVINYDSYGVYRTVNWKYADALIDLLRPDDLVWVHDYHLIPLGSELRRLGWTGRLGFFLHIPFPPAEIFGILPWARQLLTCLFDYDLVGLQTRRYVRNLQESLGDELGAALIGDTVHHQDRTLRARSFPVGADVEAFREMALSQVPTPVSRFLEDFPKDRQLLIGVDRLDYTKGIIHRMQAIERLLENYPEMVGRVTLVQISAPSRINIPEYAEEREQVDSLAGRINGRFGEADWMPIHPLHRSHSQQDLTHLYQEADACLVTPLRDGMNLVAKEFIASQTSDPGVLVLSRFCGAAESMREALMINPYDFQGTASTIHRALTMPRSERQRRWEALFTDVSGHTARDWSYSFIAALGDS